MTFLQDAGMQMERIRPIKYLWKKGRKVLWIYTFIERYLRKNGSISIEIPQPHNALIEKHDSFPLMGP